MSNEQREFEEMVMAVMAGDEEGNKKKGNGSENLPPIIFRYNVQGSKGESYAIEDLEP
jgi:hypothetical protein